MRHLRGFDSEITEEVDTLVKYFQKILEESGLHIRQIKTRYILKSNFICLSIFKEKIERGMRHQLEFIPAEVKDEIEEICSIMNYYNYKVIKWNVPNYLSSDYESFDKIEYKRVTSVRIFFSF